MIPFSVTDPYPLLSSDFCDGADAKDHARQVDEWLGLRTAETERRLLEKGCLRSAPGASGKHQELWLGLDVQDLLTPYTQFRALIALLAPRAGQCVVDLGAAYGRLGFVLERHTPEVQFLGFEYVGERIDAGHRAMLRAGLKHSRLEHADLTAREFRPPVADIYFIYDYGHLRALDKTLHDLKRVANQQPITIVARGRHCRGLIQSRHHWLKSDSTFSRVTIYQSRLLEGPAHLGPGENSLSFSDR